ncbi:MAG: response regulator [Gammaproteobacteria bacterium]|nr:response regulator [Gammaproteobacteria bacterium]
MANKVLSIDDDKFIHKVIARLLGDEYETLFASDGDEGITLAKQHIPDIIILDVEMPGKNGYEVCDAIRSDEITKDIPVIFLSSLDSIREKMQGYEAGADDYLSKSFNEAELKTKIRALLRIRDNHKKLEKLITEAQKTAFIAMTGSSELGQAMQLVEQSYAVEQYSDIANQIFSYTNSMGLSCSVLLNENETLKSYSCKGETSPLEDDLLKVLHQHNRFHDFGCRTQINYPNISLLIKNMPLEDPEKYGRIKDLFPSILAAYDSKIKSLNVDNILKQQSLTLNQSFQNIKESIGSLGTELQDNAMNGFAILDASLKEIETQLPGMGLEEDQENFILDKIDAAISSMRDVSENGSNLGLAFQTVIDQLKVLVQQQNSLLEATSKMHKKVEPARETVSTMDVELF